MRASQDHIAFGRKQPPGASQGRSDRQGRLACPANRLSKPAHHATAAHDKGFAEENEHSVQKVAREFLSRPTSASRQKSKK